VPPLCLSAEDVAFVGEALGRCFASL
jgi:hypothetical protein